MKLRFGPFLVTLAFLSAPLAWSQAGSADSSQSGSADSSQQQSASGPQPVFTHPEDKPPLAMLEEVTSHSFIHFGMGAISAWDSNAAFCLSRLFSDVVYNQSLLRAEADSSHHFKSFRIRWLPLPDQPALAA